ncbi:MAG: hypothetical protein SV375_00945 [Thermodesulfobacteriota bacterium]|nr:hypothetical protein [Thermodesulfobacteriota bacterium]
MKKNREARDNKWEEQNKKWEENQKVIYEMLTSVKAVDYRINSPRRALGVRWGLNA